MVVFPPPLVNTPLEMSTNSGIVDYSASEASTINNQVQPPDLLYLNSILHYCPLFSPLTGSPISLSTNIALFTLLEATIIVHARCNRC
jgi:hypothetical protein